MIKRHDLLFKEPVNIWTKAKIEMFLELETKNTKSRDEELESNFLIFISSGVFQNIHDSYDELKSSTLMSPKLLAMCGIVKRSHGEFDSNKLTLLSPNPQRTNTIFVNLHWRFKNKISKFCLEPGQRSYNQTEKRNCNGSLWEWKRMLFVLAK